MSKVFSTRLSDENVRKLEVQALEINSEYPEAEVTASSLFQFAVRDYLDRADKRAKGKHLFLEIPTEGLTPEQILILSEALELIPLENRDMKIIKYIALAEAIRQFGKPTSTDDTKRGE